MTNYGYGWEEETAEETYKEAKKSNERNLENTNADEKKLVDSDSNQND